MSAYYVEQARRLLAARDLAGALEACRRAVDAGGEDAEAWFLKGTVELALARPQEAHASAARSLELRPGDARSWLLAGSAQQDLGTHQASRESFSRAAELAPAWALAWHRLGTVCFDLGDAPAAEAAFARAIEADPAHVRSWNNLGHARLQAGRIDEAEQAFKRALALQPDYAHAFHNLARVALARADLETADELARIAHALEAGLADAALLRSSVARRRGDLGAARALAEGVLAANPNHLGARTQLADVLAEEGLARPALDQYRSAHASRRAALRPALGANLLLPPVYASREDLLEWRARYREGIASLESMRDGFASSGREAIARDAQWTNFYLAYQGEEDVELQRRYGDFLAAVLARAFPEHYAERPMAPRGSRIRVGFASRFFFDGTVGRYFGSWITDLDRRRFECHVYSLAETRDAITDRIVAASDAFHSCASMALPQIARRISGDALDVLVYPELGMHGATFALASMRLAPVQVSGWGHPVTSGHANIDHYLTVATMEPRTAQASYTERLHPLPGLGTRYAPSRPTGPASSPAAFGLPADRNLYLVPQSLFKVHPDNDALLARVVAADDRAHLVFFAGRHPAITRQFLDRLARSFEALGERLADRATVLPFMPHERYLEVNRACHVMLDTVHWSGGNTSVDALACGLPLVTLPGRFMRGRQSFGMLSLLELPQLVAADEDDYVGKATALARDKDALDAMRRRLGERVDSLFDRADASAALQELLATACDAR